MDVASNLADIQEKIRQACERAGRNPEEVNIIAVTKYVTIERAKEAIDAGIRHLGENRAEGLNEKFEQLSQTATWHFIGTLQSRKVKEIIDQVAVIHSLDRLSLAKEIQKRTSKKMPCFIQVNISEENTKHGLLKKDVLPFIEQLGNYPNIEVIGLMTMAPFVEDEAILRKTFRSLRELRDQIRSKSYAHAPCNYLSMGMSNDYQIAVEEGATHVRIGSKLVGESNR
ncbi:YggS family pyridoxal phosphate-dependent enzyme [Aquibacillus sp. 3ASR75-11]|uniref:Pyridoxal phosphate homeostasis protein n=1 Tax=Terrihalobacillus insolitus TaxID=2950438 RepID=A0A9X3WS60_9BACI|nr:YggS family pyridoxal phosphate-dependent enzyme [Terrihalobacillus insolitus]MDC3412846.1 YggS family pyridoxal phosphate-dependent enzyme [Terrihalobacillus insolitus]MDC3423678.1 YggS family pyridoxal phosphate-dependent enzyme [Terrihalobacillus insolitus]